MMQLTALERLDLLDQLDDMATQRETATGLDLLDLDDQIDGIMQKLGYGVEPVPAPEPTPTPQPEIPQVVTDFKEGKYKGMVGTEFLNMLKSIKEFVGGYLTLAEVFAGSDEWYRTSSYFEG